MISMIVAIGNDGEIGLNGKMLWHIKEDFAHFKETTMGHTLIMGRKTFESIGRPLPGRKTFILTRDQSYQQKGCLCFNSLDQAIEAARADGEEEVFIAGGGEIYKQALSVANRVYLSEVDFSGEADAYFPKLDDRNWVNAREPEKFAKTEKAPAWTLKVLDRS